LDACADRLWLVADGTVKPYDGDLDQYRRQVLGSAGADKMIGQGKGKTKDKRANGQGRNIEARAELKALKKRIKELESEVTKFERAIETIDAKLADATLHANNPSAAASLAKTRAGAALALAKVEEEWLAVSARAEAYA